MLQKLFSILQYTTIYLLIIVLVTTLHIFGGILEGIFYPAAAPATILSTEVVNNKVVFYGTSARLRPECNFERLEWFLGDRDGRNTPIRIDTNKSIIRPDGTFTFGPWVANIDSEDTFLNYTYANVVHKCKTFGIENPWETISVFYK